MVLTSGTGSTTARKRQVSPKWLIVVLAAVLVVAGGGAALLLTDKVDPRTAQARDAVTAYLDAWSKADYPAMAEHANVPPTRLQSALAPIRSSLEVERATYRPGAVTRKDDTATVPFTADLALKGLGSWGYDGTLQLMRGPDEVWRGGVGSSGRGPGTGLGA